LNGFQGQFLGKILASASTMAKVSLVLSFLSVGSASSVRR